MYYYIGLATIVVLFFLFRWGRIKAPQSPTDFRLNLCEVRYTNMATVNVVAKWNKSVSADVVAQELTVFFNGEQRDFFVVDPSVEEVTIEDVPESTLLKVELVASDGVFKSAAAVAELAIGDLTAPEAPTNLTLQIPVPV